MNWDDVRYFLALAREGSVNRAGRVLGVNHTTVARRITALEADLGTRLFDRTRGGYTLTAPGESMRAQALVMEDAAHALERDVFGRDQALSGPLTLTASYLVMTPLIVPHLPRFRAQYPDIDLSLETTISLTNLDAREADLAVRLSPAPPSHLVGRRVLPFEHGVYGSAAYVEALAAGTDTPRALFYGPTKTTPDWVRFYVPDAPIALRTDSADSKLAAVRAGIGLAYLPCFLADVDPDLRRVRMDLTSLDWHFWVLSHPDMKSSARVKAGRAFLVDTLLAQRELVSGATSRYADWAPERVG